MASKILNCCIKAAGWFPVLFITGIILWSYYAYVYVLCIENVKTDLERGIFLLCYHPFFLMLLWAYWRAVWTEVGTVPKQFFLSIEDREKLDSTDNPQQVLEEFSKKLPINTVTISGAVRYCEICNSIKPDRGHHCSICKSCVLKMDHHCPWVNNCVCYANYKFFLLFLFYAILYTFYVACTVFKYFLRFWDNTLEGEGKLHILFLFFVAAMFFVSLWSLFGYHTFLTMKNRSTLESFRVPNFRYGPDKNGFNLGIMRNIKEVLGENKLLWLIPVFTSLGDGVNFPLARRAPESDSLLSSPGHWLEDGEGDSSEERKTEENSYHVEMINEEQHISEDENIEISHREHSDSDSISNDHDITPTVAIESVTPDITACHSENLQSREEHLHESKSETLPI